MSHHRIEEEAKQVAEKTRRPRNVLTDPSPDIAPDMLKGIIFKSGRVEGYERGKVHMGTFYIECEGVHLYPDESFLRVIMYGNEFHDKETRIPLAMLAAAGFARQASDVGRDAADAARWRFVRCHPAISRPLVKNLMVGNLPLDESIDALISQETPHAK